MKGRVTKGRNKRTVTGDVIITGDADAGADEYGRYEQADDALPEHGDLDAHGYGLGLVLMADAHRHGSCSWMKAERRQARVVLVGEGGTALAGKDGMALVGGGYT